MSLELKELKTPSGHVIDRDLYRAALEERIANRHSGRTPDRFRIAEALKCIRDQRLYRRDYPTFEQFCLYKFGLTLEEAEKMIADGDPLKRPPAKPVVLPPKLAPSQGVYFLHAVALDLVKIGYSTKLRKRIESVQTASPVPLVLLGVWKGQSFCQEQNTHRLFAALRVKGEWFRMSPQLKAFIQSKAVPL